MWISRLLRYLVTFLFYGTLGWYFERLVIQKPFPGLIGFLPVYGFGGLLIAVLQDAIGDWNLALRVLVATALLALLECVGGKLSKWRNDGLHTWDYREAGHHWVCCDGYVSLESTLVWAVFSLLLFVGDPVRLLWPN